MEPKYLGLEGEFASNQTDFAPTQYYLARGLTISNQEFKPETLLAVPIRDDEIFELLERLAATEEMFKVTVSTIRDVAELTDASPTLIARILGDMRGTSEFEGLVNRVDSHEFRIQNVEQTLRSVPGMPQPSVNYFESYQQYLQENQELSEPIRPNVFSNLWVIVALAIGILVLASFAFLPLANSVR